MLKHAADLSDSHEYFIVWAGETNARPWGAKADAYSLFPEFELARDGLDSVTAAVTSVPATTFVITLAIGVSITKNEFAGATLRLGSTTTGDTGYGTIVSHDAITSPTTTGNLTILWAVAPIVNSSLPCYIVREIAGLRKRAYHAQVRVLTPYQPVVDSATAAIVTYPVTTTGGRALLPPQLPVGTIDQPAMMIVLQHPGGPQTGPVSLEQMTVQCLDQADQPLVPGTYVDRARAMRGGAQPPGGRRRHTIHPGLCVPRRYIPCL